LIDSSKSGMGLYKELMKHGCISDIKPIGTSHDPAIKKSVLFRNGEIPHVTQVAQAVFLPGQHVKAHSHETMYELFICSQGEGRVILNNQEHQFHEGDFILCEPNDTHEVINDGQIDLVMTVFGIQK